MSGTIIFDIDGTWSKQLPARSGVVPGPAPLSRWQAGCTDLCGTPPRSRFEHDHAPACLQGGTQRGDGALQHLAGHTELPGRYPGEPAAQGPGRHLHGESRVLQHGGGGLAHVGMEAVGECVRPQVDRRPGPARATARMPASEALPGEARQLAVPIDAACQLERAGQPRCPADRVHRCRGPVSEQREDRQPNADPGLEFGPGLYR